MSKTHGVRHGMRKVQLTSYVAFDTAKLFDDLLDLSGLNQSELVELLIIKGVEAFRASPELVELQRRREVARNVQLVGSR